MRDARPRVLAGAIVWGAMTLLIACGCDKPAPAAAPPAPAVTAARPARREVIEWDEYTGRLQAVETVEVRARVSGYIEKADFAEGKVVNAGEVLFVIDSRPFDAELARAQAEVSRAQAQRGYAANEFKRLQDIRGTGAGSEVELENARQRLLEAEAAIAAADAVVRQAQLNVEWCRVTAPIAGRISRKEVTPGNLINGGTGQTTLLTTITSIDPIYCYIEADERSVLRYQQLAIEKKRISARDEQIPCFMALSNEQGFPHAGVVNFVDNRIDPETGTLRARGVFANETRYLLPGTFARVRIPGSGRYHALLVPDSAISSDQNQKFVLVVGADGTVQRRPVKLGALFNGARAIEEGIGPDDRVIINGLQRARPGTKVAATEVPYEPAIPLTAPGSPATQQLPPATRPASMTSASIEATTARAFPAQPKTFAVWNVFRQPNVVACDTAPSDPSSVNPPACEQT